MNVRQGWVALGAADQSMAGALAAEGLHRGGGVQVVDGGDSVIDGRFPGMLAPESGTGPPSMLKPDDPTPILSAPLGHADIPLGSAAVRCERRQRHPAGDSAIYPSWV